MLLNILAISGHEYPSLSPHPDEGLEVAPADPPLSADAVCNQVAGVDPATDGLGRDPEDLRRILDGEQSAWEVSTGRGAGRHGHCCLIS